VPSVVDTPGEQACAQFLYDLLASEPYFQAHPDHLLLLPTRDDTRTRSVLMALVRGNSAPADEAPAYILLGHLDTVDTADYGALRHLACDPPALAKATDAPPTHMVGRGALDMKSGVATNLAILLAFAAGEGPQDASLLLVACPDEEGASHGMLTAVDALPEVASRWGLALKGAINTDFIAPRFPGDQERPVFLGTIGKLLPSVFVAGVETHAGAPFGGFDPNWLTAEVVRRVDYNLDLCDEAFGEVTPPPVSLKSTDLKAAYSVQTPLYGWAYFNWFTMQRPCDQVLAQFRSVVQDAFTDLHKEFLAKVEAHAARTRVALPRVAWRPAVYTFQELSDIVRQRRGAAFEAEAARDLLAAQPDLDPRAFCCRLTERLWEASGLQAPAAVVGFAHVYSPPVHTAPTAPLARAAAAATREVSHDTGYTIPLQHYFPYISDMSFLDCPEPPSGLEALRRNNPGWQHVFRVDHEAHACLGLPVVNIGPWGEGAHTRHERVERLWSFGVVPELVWRTFVGAAKA
jgi:arginine utilization protein RocB